MEVQLRKSGCKEQQDNEYHGFSFCFMLQNDHQRSQKAKNISQRRHQKNIKKSLLFTRKETTQQDRKLLDNYHSTSAKHYRKNWPFPALTTKAKWESRLLASPNYIKEPWPSDSIGQRKLSGEPRSMRYPLPEGQWRPRGEPRLPSHPALMRHTSVSHWGSLAESRFHHFPMIKRLSLLQDSISGDQTRTLKFIFLLNRNKGQPLFSLQPLFYRSQVGTWSSTPIWY